MSDVVPGRCACGAVRLRLTPPTLMVSHCHCADCRAVHAAAFVTWASVAARQLEVTGKRSSYESSPGVRREFCPRCGTAICYLAEASAGRVYVPVAVFEAALDRAPEAHVNVAERAPWCAIGGALPRFDGFD